MANTSPPTDINLPVVWAYWETTRCSLKGPIGHPHRMRAVKKMTWLTDQERHALDAAIIPTTVFQIEQSGASPGTSRRPMSVDG